jgi:hypothetical protein
MARRNWAWLVTVLPFAGGVLWAVLPPGHWRRGSLLMGASLLLGAFLRWVLRSRAGLLMVRSRALDTIILTVLGIGIATLAIFNPILPGALIP